MRWWLLVLPVLLLACPSAASDGPGPFAATRNRDHPLVGTLLETGDSGPEEISWPTLVERVSRARFVLLGEIHDNPDHHRIQARLVALLGTQPHPPAVVFEMLDAALQDEIDGFRAAGSPADVDAFARRVGWADSGWPDFALYRPIFLAALGARLPILAAGSGRGSGVEPDDRLVARFGLDRPLPDGEQAERIEEMFEGHCQLVPREQLGPMVEIQRGRDGRFAQVLLAGAELRGRAVLIAGSGHVERGGVPALLRHAGVPADEILSVGLLEVRPEDVSIDETRAGRFDAALFTPGAEREDPCEGLRKHFETRGHPELGAARQ